LRARRYVEEHHNFATLANRLEQVLQSALPEQVHHETSVLATESH